MSATLRMINGSWFAVDEGVMDLRMWTANQEEFFRQRPEALKANQDREPSPCAGCVICVQGGMILQNQKGQFIGAGVEPYDDPVWRKSQELYDKTWGEKHD